MSIGKIRTILYETAKLLGDINAVRRGRVKERLMWRLVGKVMGRFLGKWFR